MQETSGLTPKTPTRSSPWATAQAYILALLIMALALLIRLPLSPVFGGPYTTLFAGVALAAWLTRWKATIVAAMVAFIAANRVYVTDPLSLRLADFIDLGVYAISAATIIFLVEHLQRSRERVQQYAGERAAALDAERRQKDLLRVTLASIGDAVITTDGNGRVTGLNAMAEQLTGWSESEAIGQPLETIFRAVNEQTRQPIDSPVARALRDGVVTGLANHSVLISKSGDERPIDDSAAPIRSGSGHVLGCVLIFRDVSERRDTEREILANREKLRITLASIGDGVIVTDADGRVRSLNQEAERLTGWQSEDAAGLPLSDVFSIVNEVSGKRVENPVDRVLREGMVVGLANHTLLISKDGTRTPIDDSAAPIREDNGPLLGVVLVFRDVARQREFERTQAHLAAIVQYSGDAIVTKDLNGIVQTWNQSAQELFGYTPEEIIGKSITVLLPPERIHEEAEILARLRQGQPSERLETVRVAKDGRRIFVSLSISPLRDRDGNIIGASKVVHDITDRKIAEDALRESEQRFRTLADAAPVLIWISGTDKRFTWFNKQWLDFVGRPMEQEIGNGWADNVYPDDLNHCLETYTTKFDAREPFTMMYRLKRHDGEYRWVLDTGAPRIGSNNDFAGYIGSCIDITERRQAEESLREADRRKDEFLAVLSHELRNPLAPIAMAVAVMQRKPAADQQEQELRNIIQRQTAQLGRLLDDLLDVNRIRSGKVVLRKERVPLDTAVSRAVEAVKPQIDTRHQKLVVNLPREPVHVNADMARITQVIANLLSNACKYTPAAGNITLTVIPHGDNAILSVRDSGIGISPDQIPRIFDMFAQVSPALERTESGLGVGLALTRTLVELHGGTIEVRSEGPGKGSEFIVQLPADRSAASAETKAAVLPPERAPSTPRKILVADDNIDSAQMLARALRELGHDVRVAHDGIATIEEAKKFAADVAILDIGMPRMNGYDVSKTLRKRFGPGITLIALTGWGQEADKHRAAEASFDHHLTKPVDLRAVEHLLQSVSDGERAPH